MEYTQDELDMARKGYVYYAAVAPGQAYRKQVRNIHGEDRAKLIFDWPAYECHSANN